MSFFLTHFVRELAPVTHKSVQWKLNPHELSALVLLASWNHSIVIDYRKNELEEQMLMNLHRRQWTEGLVMKRFEDHETSNQKTVEVSTSDVQS